MRQQIYFDFVIYFSLLIKWLFPYLLFKFGIMFARYHITFGLPSMTSQINKEFPLVHWYKKAFILIAASVWVMIPFFGAASEGMPAHDPGPGITLDKGTGDDSLWQASNAWGSEIHAINNGIGGTLRQGPRIELIPGKNSRISDGEISPVTPELGSFIVIGAGLLTLAGWGKRKLRR